MHLNQAHLMPLALHPLPLGAITPLGWLRRQLRLQADGLSGHLDEFWPDIAQSGWIGGAAEGWERGPYWLDGVVPLAFLLDDATLLAKSRYWVDYMLTHQQPDGWLGPIQSPGGKYLARDPWPTFVALKALTQYADASDDARVVPAIQRCLRCIAALLAETPLYVWGKSRWADLALTVYWLYDRTGEGWLLELAATLQAQGYDWRGHFEDFAWKGKVPREQACQETHVVNNAMALKTPGVWSRQSHDPADRAAIWQMLGMLDTYHGQATGLFSGDEHYAGRSPSQGTELCAVVEFMYSLEALLSIQGQGAEGVRLADRLEKLAYNALPATFSPDMWAHQYDQQANQAICCVAEQHVYATNGPDANLFGLEPNYGCCTANLSQGWPKFAASLWMATPDGGLAAVVHAPSRVSHLVGGAQVSVTCETDYPFDETLHLTVQAEGAATFPLWLRIPAWATGATVRVASDTAQDVAAGDWVQVERTWHQTTEITLRLPMRPVVQRRYNDAVSIARGPLVYALKIAEEWRHLRGELPHADWEVHPATPWNYGLLLDPDHPEASLRFAQRPVGERPFSPEGAPMIATARGRRIPEWGLERNAAAPPPASPATSDMPLEALALIPYGCTSLRITEFPLLSR